MSIRNRVTLTQFGRLTTTAEDALPVDQLAVLLDDVAGKEARIKAVKAKLECMLARRYGSTARRLSESGHEPAECVTLPDGDYIVTACVPQDVTWDQRKLARLAETIFHDWQRDPEDYITISYTVEEQTYLAWPADLRTQFEDARAVGVGKQSFAIQRKPEAA